MERLAEAARVQADLEAKNARNTLIAEEDRLRNEKLANEAEERRLAEVAYNATKAEQKIQDDLLAQTRLAAQATSQAEIDAAEIEEQRLKDLAAKYETDRLEALNKKNLLLEEIASEEQRLQLAKASSAAADLAAKAANASAIAWEANAVE